MTWVYTQLSGALSHDGAIVGLGYSGIDDGLNNHADENMPNLGPIPVGTYNIGDAFTHSECGPVSMRLEPDQNTDTFGRSGFLIHGDNQQMNHTASHGCIILPRIVRAAIASSKDKALVVVEG
jgi:hypothetical protein